MISYPKVLPRQYKVLQEISRVKRPLTTKNNCPRGSESAACKRNRWCLPLLMKTSLEAKIYSGDNCGDAAFTLALTARRQPNSIYYFNNRRRG